MKMVFSLMLVLGLISCGVQKDSDQVTPLDLDDVSDKVLPDQEPLPVENPLLKSVRLEPFGTQENFNSYLLKLRAAQQQERDRGDHGEGSTGSCPDCVNEAMPSPPVSAAPADGADGNEDITNNQEAGVDEGGIVKVIGDHLIVLRRGRLFSVLVQNDENGPIELRDTVEAFPPQHSTHTWYDELLVYKNKIIVVGYSYGYGATEIGQFVLGEDGKISHQGTYFLRSHDYYSSRNYASRLIDGKLVFYTPFYFVDRYGVEQNVTLPGQATLLPSGHASDWQDIIDTSTIIQPIEETVDPVLHTIAICDLNASDFSCAATSVIGPYARTFYVSPNAVFLWTAGADGSSVYRLPLDGSRATAALVDGAPTDQFSFKEAEDGILHVLLRDSGYGDAMWAPEFREGGVALLSLPLALFSSEPVKILGTNYAVLSSVEGNSLRNRFVGDTVLYGSEKFREGNSAANFINIYDVKTRAQKAIALGHDVQRIEAIGRDAVVVGSQGDDLLFSSIGLEQEAPDVVDTYILKNSAQGEHRSHGFFYKPVSESGGILGLPISQGGTSFSELRETSASVQFLSVEENHFASLGALDSTIKSNVNDNCKISCIDWYGNSRPIFLGGRIFALLGYDIIEGTLSNNVLTERQRFDFTPMGPQERP